MRRLFAALVPLLALTGLLAACSDDDSPTPAGGSDAPLTVGGLDQITVTGESGQKPTLGYTWPYSAENAERRVVSEGTGEVVAAGDRVSFDYVTINGTTGSELETSFGGGGPATLVLDESQGFSVLVKAVIGAKVGSRLLISVPPSARDDQQVASGPDDTLIFVLDVKAIRRALPRATGTPVEPVAGLPTVQLDPVGKPTITIPAADPPTHLVVQPLITGEGTRVAAGQTVTVHFTGLIWTTGEQFDSSWDRSAPEEFVIGAGRVIPAWDEAIEGQPVGSQLLLVVPPEQGYGAAGNSQAGIAGTDTLVFVVDILDAA